jgi:nucleoside-diphosphate-sugar epimerase
MSPKRVLVTGATGFVGRALLPALAAEGYSIRVAVRRTAAPQGFESVPVGEIDDRTDCSAAVREVDMVVHLAARAHILQAGENELAEFRRVNRDGTERLARASAAAGVRQFIYVSSVKAVGESSGDQPWDETVPPDPTTPYGISKWEGEQAALAATTDAMRVAVLRPTLIYGPGNIANMQRLLKAVDAGLPLPLGSVRNRRSLLFLGNFIAALLAALRQGIAGTYFVADGEDLSTPGLIRALAKGLRRPARLWPFPPALLRAAAVLARRRDDADRIFNSLAVDATLFRRVASWTPPCTTTEGLAATAAWYLESKSGEAKGAAGAMRASG